MNYLLFNTFSVLNNINMENKKFIDLSQIQELSNEDQKSIIGGSTMTEYGAGAVAVTISAIEALLSTGS